MALKLFGLPSRATGRGSRKMAGVVEQQEYWKHLKIKKPKNPKIKRIPEKFLAIPSF